MSDYTKEPWEYVPMEPGRHRFVEIKRVDYARAVACVNACEGLANPGAIKGLIRFVRAALAHEPDRIYPEFDSEAAELLLEKLDE